MSIIQFEHMETRTITDGSAISVTKLGLSEHAACINTTE